jgi:hypothetical protein
LEEFIQTMRREILGARGWNHTMCQYFQIFSWKKVAFSGVLE